MPYAVPGSPKLIAINLTNDSIMHTYSFPASVHFPGSYMNDLRFDMRSNATASGTGIAYIVDSSNEGRTGFIMLDLGTGFIMAPTNPTPLNAPRIRGCPIVPRHSSVRLACPLQYPRRPRRRGIISLWYYSPLTGNHFYSIETQHLRANPANDTLSAQRASKNVKNLGQRGANANGFAGDSNGAVYMLMPEQNAIYNHNSTSLQAEPYIRYPLIIWPDSANVGFDGYIYSIINQLPYQPIWNNGTDLRRYPGVILRAKLPNDGTNSTVLGLPV